MHSEHCTDTTEMQEQISLTNSPFLFSGVAQCFGHGASGKATWKMGEGRGIGEVHSAREIARARDSVSTTFCS